MIGIHFKDFKALSKNHRVYYFLGENFVDLQFLSDGMIVKTTVMEDQIENKEKFFEDELFYGAVQLTFPIPDTKPNLVTEIQAIKKPLESPITDIEIIASEEVKNTDIQREGVDMDEAGNS